MRELLDRMHAWMGEYIKPFHTGDAEVEQGIRLKEEHTGLVTANSVAIAKSLGLSAHDIELAEMIGLFHDVGRFLQYTLYKTFNDGQSEDHAALGLKVLSDMPLVDELSPKDKDILFFAVFNHNKRDIAPAEDGEKLLFARIIRDADKLDIYRVLAPFLRPGNEYMAPKFMASTNDQDVSPELLDCLVKGKQADYRLIRTNGDRRIVRLLWVYDINFPYTMARLKESGYLEEIMEYLTPKNEAMALGLKKLNEYIENFIKQASHA